MTRGVRKARRERPGTTALAGATRSVRGRLPCAFVAAGDTPRWTLALLATACGAGGALIGASAVTWLGKPAPDIEPTASDVTPDTDLPSLAPLVDAVRMGVVGVHTIHRLDDPVDEGGTEWEPDPEGGIA